MNIIKKLRGEHVINYILFVWQQEDLARACGMSIDEVEKRLLGSAGEEERKDLRDWYDNLISMLENEGKKAEGHSQFIIGLTDEVNSLHTYLLRTPEYIEYNTKFYMVLPLLAEFRQKNKSGAEVNDIELLITAIYGVMLLRLSGKEVSEDTMKAVREFTAFANEVAMWFNKYEKGELKME